MADGPELPPRPAPPRRFSDTVVPWLNWFGPGRIAAIVVMVGVVGIGAYWLVRAPVPPAEAGLPFAAASASGPSSSVAATPGNTLPPPATAAPVAAAETETAVVVHVAGAVVASGVYRLTGDARVHRAIEAAGGATADADLDGLNLAAPVLDGQRIYVPTFGEVDPASVPELPVVASSAEVASGPIDLNVATAAQLETLPGVGPSTAIAIIDDRDRNGPFASVDDLDRVAGIGPAKLGALRDLVTV